MRKGHLNVVAGQMNRRIKRLLIHLLLQEIQQTILRLKFLPVEHERQPRVQVRIIATHLLHEGSLEIGSLWKQRAIHLKGQARPSLGLVCPWPLHLLNDLAFAKLDRLRLPFAPGLNLKKLTQGIHRLNSHAVQSHRFLKGLTVVFRPGINFGGTIHQLSKRNPPPKITHFDTAGFIDIDGNFLTMSHHKFVYRVVQSLLQKDVYPVIRR